MYTYTHKFVVIVICLFVLLPFYVTTPGAPTLANVNFVLIFKGSSVFFSYSFRQGWKLHVVRSLIHCGVHKMFHPTISTWKMALQKPHSWQDLQTFSMYDGITVIASPYIYCFLS